MTFMIELEQEEDGRWLAEVLELTGVLVYGQTPEEATAKAQALHSLQRTRPQPYRRLTQLQLPGRYIARARR